MKPHNPRSGLFAKVRKIVMKRLPRLSVVGRVKIAARAATTNQTPPYNCHTWHLHKSHRIIQGQ